MLDIGAGGWADGLSDVFQLRGKEVALGLDCLKLRLEPGQQEAASWASQQRAVEQI